VARNIENKENMRKAIQGSVRMYVNASAKELGYDNDDFLRQRREREEKQQ